MRFNCSIAPKNTPRVPLRTLEELAEEFGVTRHQLICIAGGNAACNPMPSSEFSGYRGTHGRYYNPVVVRAWWAALPRNQQSN